MEAIELLDDVLLKVRFLVKKLDGYSQALAMYKEHHAKIELSFGVFGEQFFSIRSKEPFSKEKIEEFNDRIEDLRDLFSRKTALQACSLIETLAKKIFLDEKNKTDLKNANDIKEYFSTETDEDKYEIAWEPAKSPLQYFIDRRRNIISSHKDAIDVLDMKNLKWLNLHIKHNKHAFYRSITFYDNHIYVFMNDIISNIEMRPAALVEESFDEVQKMIAEELASKLTEFSIDAKEYVRKI